MIFRKIKILKFRFHSRIHIMKIMCIEKGVIILHNFGIHYSPYADDLNFLMMWLMDFTALLCTNLTLKITKELSRKTKVVFYLSGSFSRQLIVYSFEEIIMVRSRSSSKVHPETKPTSDETIVPPSNSSFCNVREITCLITGNFGWL